MKHADKLKHLAVFTAGYEVTLVAAIHGFGLSFGWASVAAAFFLAAAAFVTEDRQKQQEGRVKDGWDAYADMLAVIPGNALYLVVSTQFSL